MKTPFAIAIAVLCASAPAFAGDEPDAPPAPPPADAPAPEAPKPPEEPAKPVEPPPAAEAKPAPAPAPAPTPSAPTSTSTSAFEVGVESGAAPAQSDRRRSPKFALELSALGATNANPYLQHDGWNFETGPARGFRIEAQWIGISLGVETSTMKNERVCGVGCFEGDFGNTTMLAADVGFRFRFPLGPVRLFAAGAVGGIRASSGDWTMKTKDAVLGGHVRGSAGVELPLPANLYAVGQLGYRFGITQNPLRDPDKETLDAALLGTEATAANYVEDVHQIVLSVGVGIVL